MLDRRQVFQDEGYSFDQWLKLSLPLAQASVLYTFNLYANWRFNEVSIPEYAS